MPDTSKLVTRIFSPTCKDKARERYANLTEQLEQQKSEQLEALSKYDLVNVLRQGAGVLTTLIGGTASRIADEYFIQSLAKPISQAVAGVVGMTYTALPIFKLVFLSITTTELKKQLQRRIEMSQALELDLQFILQLLNQVVFTGEQVNLQADSSLQQVLQEVRQARAIVDRELQKGQLEPISNQQLTRSVRLLEQALRRLEYVQLPIPSSTARQLTELNVRFNLNNSGALDKFVVSLLSGQQKLSIAFVEEYFREVKRELSSRVETSDNLQTLFNQYLQAVSSTPFGRYIYSILLLFSVFPVYARVARKLPSVSGVLQVALQVNANQFTIVEPSTSAQYPEGNYAEVTQTIRGLEAAVASSFSWYSELNQRYGGLKTFLKQAEEILASTQSSLKQAIDEDKARFRDVQLKRPQWIAEITAAKGLIEGSIPAAISFTVKQQTFVIPPYNAQRADRQVRHELTLLEEFLEKKYAPKEPADEALRVGQLTFRVEQDLIASGATVVYSGATALYSKFRSNSDRTANLGRTGLLRRLLQQQRSLDQEELILCSRILQTISSVPGIGTATELFNALQTEFLSPVVSPHLLKAFDITNPITRQNLVDGVLTVSSTIQRLRAKNCLENATQNIIFEVDRAGQPIEEAEREEQLQQQDVEYLLLELERSAGVVEQLSNFLKF